MRWTGEHIRSVRVRDVHRNIHLGSHVPVGERA